MASSCPCLWGAGAGPLRPGRSWQEASWGARPALGSGEMGRLSVLCEIRI